MADWKNATATTGGVLRPEELARHVSLKRHPAGDVAASWVENRWSLRWGLPEGRWFASEVLPHPTCSLTLEHLSHPRPEQPRGETLLVTGVCTRRFDVEVRGRGLVNGLRFRPGGLVAVSGVPAGAWVDHTVAASEVLPATLVASLADPALAEDADAWASVAEEGVADLARSRGPDERYVRLLEVVADMLEEPSLLTVGDVAERHGTTPRSLQRLFERYLGVGPKWVLARYRMHDVVSALDAGDDGSITDLAHRYGWYDQAHFTREFTALVGVPPARYRDRGRSRSGGPEQAHTRTPAGME
ncbi:helix-turn-helix transcriptional regulator [Phycicoccus sp. CSK15P-2]|uniref:helix-turn-helix domain-containing protein n=1 Tax=Phycicoccus sp. CSK15P-2 TaxID=2807627 RepID=UPI001950614C|nr:AraC family transcriptional regulator [Phycicoccus sp. CSK15P-2]MBM6404508.1 helix-turn-helix transcriptional regulator [Phycicoccus sp. CSK15P-2]